VVGLRLLAVALAICVQASTANAAQPSEVDRAKEDQITDGVALARNMLDAQMFDFGSARVRGVNAGVTRDKTVICGFINGKNRIGAYVGWRQFAVFGDQLIVPPENPLDPSWPEKSATVEMICGTDGKVRVAVFRDAYASPTDWTAALSPG